jgi:outer membrane protein OmpA-like peptidoglycan-associated protein
VKTLLNYVIVFLFLLLSECVNAQVAGDTYYYVIVGGFAKIDNANRYQVAVSKDPKLSSILKDQFSSKIAFNPARNINYVYIQKTTDKKGAFALNIKLKAETEYKDSWVFAGNLDADKTESIVLKTEERIQQVNEKPEEKKAIEVPKIDSTKMNVENKPIVEKKIEAEPQPKPAVVEKKRALSGKPFIFKLADKASGKEVNGAAHIYESAKAGEFQSFPANQIAYVQEPINKTKTYLIRIQAPGFKPSEKIIQYGQFDSLKLDQKETVVAFDLVKVKSGDYIDFNNVRFVKNSPIMKADSQNELDGLVTLMKENPRYKIKIHGFCNGTGKREIISRGSSDKFFELEPEKNKKHTKSAKDLSLERAEIVKAFLISQGIEANRLSVKAEGGDIPLYGENSSMASQNDRIEIEVKSN